MKMVSSFASFQAQHFKSSQFNKAKIKISQTLRFWQLNILSLLHQLKKIKKRFGVLELISGLMRYFRGHKF